MPGMELSDNELAVLAGRGDPEAYRRLFDRYRKPVYNFVYRLVDNAEDASDIVQDAFIRIYSVLGATEIQNFSAYLYRTAKNLAYDEMRRRARFADFDEEMLLPEDPNIYADPQRALLLGEQMETVRRAARGLNEKQRAALILRELQELDYDQMSDVLESNRNAVGALLSRARLKFREELRMAQVSTDQCPSGCEEVIAMLSPYIDGELTAAANEKVEAHLEDCTFCLAALEEMKEASRSFRMFLPVVPPPGVAQAFTGWLAELTGSGAGDPTQESPQGRGGGSGLSRLLGSKAIWIAAGVAVVMLATASVLAWGALGGQESAPPAFQDTGTDAAITGPGSRTDTNSVRSTPAVIDTTEQTGTETMTMTTPTTTTDSSGNYAPVKVMSGYASPEQVFERQPVSFVAVIKGGASSVTVDLVPQSGGPNVSVSLARTASGTAETWSAAGTAGTSGTYYIYISATDVQGRYDSLYVGNLTVSAAIR